MTKKQSSILITVLAVLLVIIVVVAVRKNHSTPSSTEEAGSVQQVAGSLITTIDPAASSTNRAMNFHDPSTDQTKAISLQIKAGKAVLSDESKQIAELPDQIKDSERVSFLGQINSHLYVGVFPEVFGGYQVYPLGALRVYQVDPVKGTVVTLKGSADDFIYAIGETADNPQVNLAAVDFNHHELHLVSADGKLQGTITLPSMYTSFGDVSFSPDSKNIAFAASLGIPGAERGAVYTAPVQGGNAIPLTTGMLTNQPDHVIRVRGWKDSTTPIFDSVRGPQ